MFAVEAVDMITGGYDFHTKDGDLKKYWTKLLLRFGIPVVPVPVVPGVPVVPVVPTSYERFNLYNRCTFSFATDITTEFIYQKCIAGREVDANMLFRVLISHTILNNGHLMKNGFIEEIQLPIISAMTNDPKRLHDWFHERWEFFGDSEDHELRSKPAIVPPSAYMLSLISFLYRFEGGPCFLCGESGYAESMPAFLGEAAKWCQFIWGPLSKILRKGETFKNITSAVHGLVRNTPWFGGEQHTTPPFLCFVFLRTMSLADARFFDWDSDFIGTYAAVGMYLSKGIPEADAKRMANNKNRAQKDFVILCERVREEAPAAVAAFGEDKSVKHLDPKYNGPGIIKVLVDNGLGPYSNQSIEHMLCEYRKNVSVAPAKRRHKKTSIEICNDSVESEMIKEFFTSQLPKNKKGAKLARDSLAPSAGELNEFEGLPIKLHKALSVLNSPRVIRNELLAEFKNRIEKCMFSRAPRAKLRFSTEAKKNTAQNALLSEILVALRLRAKVKQMLDNPNFHTLDNIPIGNQNLLNYFSVREGDVFKNLGITSTGKAERTMSGLGQTPNKRLCLTRT